jgi:hypothetical protein
MMSEGRTDPLTTVKVSREGQLDNHEQLQMANCELGRTLLELKRTRQALDIMWTRRTAFGRRG